MKKYLIVLSAIAFTFSCSDFGDLNVNPKQAELGEAPPETLFAAATKQLSDQMTSTDVNQNIFRLFAQQWTETTYTDETNYDLITRDQPGNHWNELYRDVLKDFAESRRLIDMADNQLIPPAVIENQLATISILEVFTYHVLVDTYGDVPYSDAIDIDNVLPTYDDDQEVYNAIISDLDDALDRITVGEASFGDSDLIYGGDMAAWVKFANSLKLRMAVRIAQVQPEKAATMATEAVDGGVFESNADNAIFQYLSADPNTNPVWVSLVQSGRQDFIPANTNVDIMNELGDPRRKVYYDTNLEGDYIGGIYGSNSPYRNYTHLGEIFHQPETPGDLLDYPEVEFLLAEAAELNLIESPADAETHYNNAIIASFVFWGANDGDPDLTPTQVATTYLAKPEVAYATAAPTWQEKIAVQKWLHLFNRGFEAWCTYRLYGYPEMNVPEISEEPVPRRYTYPIDEPSVNGASYTAAAQAMGGDEKSSRVFWDVE